MIIFWLWIAKMELWLPYVPFWRSRPANHPTPAPSAIHRCFSPQMILFWLWIARWSIWLPCASIWRSRPANSPPRSQCYPSSFLAPDDFTLALDSQNGTYGYHTLHFGDLGPQTLPAAPSAIHRRFSPPMILFWFWIANMERMAATRSILEV